jgi:peptide-methionine (S)-S-oxide reductase
MTASHVNRDTAFVSYPTGTRATLAGAGLAGAGSPRPQTCEIGVGEAELDWVGAHPHPTTHWEGIMTSETAILAGGCFWGVQDLIRKQPGVLSTRVGYTGGSVANATYRNHEGHAEAIEITFDPDKTSYRDLLEFFFQIHDPTTVDRQGNDIGSSYRSAIFYLSDAQKSIAEDTIADVNASGLWPGQVVTEVTAAGPFWEAEPEHQDYLQNYPDGYTCHFVRPGWKLPHRADSVTS